MHEEAKKQYMNIIARFLILMLWRKNKHLDDIIKVDISSYLKDFNDYLCNSYNKM